MKYIKPFLVVTISIIAIAGLALHFDLPRLGAVDSSKTVPNVEPKLGAGVEVATERGYIDFNEVGIDTNEHNYLIGLLQIEEQTPNPKVIVFNDFNGSPEEILLLKLYALDEEVSKKLGAKDKYNAKSLLADVKKAKIRKDDKVLVSAENVKIKYDKYKLK